MLGDKRRSSRPVTPLHHASHGPPPLAGEEWCVGRWHDNRDRTAPAKAGVWKGWIHPLYRTDAVTPAAVWTTGFIVPSGL